MDFTFYWNAPSSIWVRCGTCDEQLEVNYGETIEAVQRRVERHVHIETDYDNDNDE